MSIGHLQRRPGRPNRRHQRCWQSFLFVLVAISVPASSPLMSSFWSFGSSLEVPHIRALCHPGLMLATLPSNRFPILVFSTNAQCSYFTPHECHVRILVLLESPPWYHLQVLLFLLLGYLGLPSGSPTPLLRATLVVCHLTQDGYSKRK